MPNSLYYGDNRTVETTLNVHLADLLRNQGLDASAERRKSIHNRSQQPDVIVSRMDLPIRLEQVGLR